MPKKTKVRVPEQFSLAVSLDNVLGEFDTVLKDMEKKGRPFELHLCSEGGDMTVALAMAGMVRLSKVPITTVVYGEVCSSAVAVFVSGKQRVMEKNAMIMLHETYLTIKEPRTIADTKRFLEKAELQYHQYLQILEQNSTMSYSYWKKLIENHGGVEIWIDAKQALKLGLCDKII